MKPLTCGAPIPHVGGGLSPDFCTNAHPCADHPADPPRSEFICPSCRVERADYEGPGAHLPACPNCGSSSAPQRTEASVERYWSPCQENMSRDTRGGWVRGTDHDAAVAKLEAELLRLNGPTCPHDGKRASEHREHAHTIPKSFEPLIPAHLHEYEACLDCDMASHADGAGEHCSWCHESPDDCDGTPMVGPRRPPHPPCPEIEDWLRDNARR